MRGKRVDFSVKTVMIGDSGVGKSCILTRYIHDFFDAGSRPTLGVEFMAKRITTPKRHIELQLWDTAGQELFRSVTRGYYRNSSVAYVVFDLTIHASFQAVGGWIADVREVALPDVIIVLIGNKADLTENRNVTKEEIQFFIGSSKIQYFEVSAKTGDNVIEAITSILPQIDERADRGEFQNAANADSIMCSSAAEPTGFKCCWTS
jgi:small GTP-binding protein